MRKANRQFVAVRGYFRQDEDGIDGKTFDFKHHNFGLRPFISGEKCNGTAQVSWQKFEEQVNTLNRSSGIKTTYKVFFLGCHGQPGDNSDTKRWKNSKISWKNPPLSKRGILQAKETNMFWIFQVVRGDMPLPQSYYTSPQKKALETVQIIYSGLAEEDDQLKVIVKDKLRTSNGLQDPDCRDSKSEILEAYPHFEFEDGFTNTDELWETMARETDQDSDKRMELLLEDIFDHDANMFVSLTTHSGSIAALLRVIGHREFDLSPGHILPVLVKQTKTDL